MWSGKTAVVTGASGGIGSAVCRVLADEGLRVIGLDNRPSVDDQNTEVTGKGTIQSRVCDVTKLEEVAETFKWLEETFGGTDLLVNCAGHSAFGQITNVGDNQISDEEVAATMNVNIIAMIFCTRHAFASMKKRGFGHIVNINSIAGHYIPFTENFNVYASSKYAVTGFTGSLANELSIFGSKIKTTSICPGLVRTPLVEKYAIPPQQPALRPRDVAEAVRYVVTTPAHVNITQLTVQPVGEKPL